MQRAWDVGNVLNKKFRGMPFTGKWKEAMGCPDVAGNWIVWGQSGSGKTTFNMMLAKYISNFETVLYNSLEEGLSASIQNTYGKVGITTKSNILLVSESMDDMNQRLMRQRSPNVAIIDSIKYTRFNWKDYAAFSKRHPDVQKIWIGHADGREPRGTLAKDIRYDAAVKIYTEGFRAFFSSRFSTGGETYMDIWPEKAAEYYTEKAT